MHKAISQIVFSHRILKDEIHLEVGVTDERSEHYVTTYKETISIDNMKHVVYNPDNKTHRISINLNTPLDKLLYVVSHEAFHLMYSIKGMIASIPDNIDNEEVLADLHGQLIESVYNSVKEYLELKK